MVYYEKGIFCNSKAEALKLNSFRIISQLCDTTCKQFPFPMYISQSLSDSRFLPLITSSPGRKRFGGQGLSGL